MRFLFVLSFLLIVPCVRTGFAQSNTVIQKDMVGTVWETSENDSTGTSIPGANVLLLNAVDSSLVKGTTTALNGTFLFSGIERGNYILTVSFLGYMTSCIQITPEHFRENRMIDIGKIVLKESAISLADVVIKGQMSEVVVKEDTLEYNSAAFKMHDGAVVEDLLKRLPGVEVEVDGTIKDATGKQVTKIMVNGKDFFRKDPKMATRNLTADMIDKIQVIEKKLDQAILTGVDDGEKETIINLTIKKNMMNGWSGNVTAGAGVMIDDKFDDGPRYNLRSTLNKFTENTQTTFVVNANNIRARESGGGITNSNTFGFNTATVVNDKLKIGAEVEYIYSEEYAKRNSFRTNLMIDSVSYRRSETNNQNYSHELGIYYEMEYKPNNFYTIVFEPEIVYNRNHSRDVSFYETLAGDIDSTRVNWSDTRSSMKSNELTMEGYLAISRSFEKTGRRLSVTMTGISSLSTGNGTNISNSEFFLVQGKDKYLDQESVSSKNTGSFNFRVSHVEPLLPNLRLQLSYNYRRNETLNIRETYDLDNYGAYSLLNTDYSKSLDNSLTTQTIGISLRGTSYDDKYNYTVGMNFLPSNTQSTSFIKNGTMEGSDSILNHIKGRKVINYSPQIEVTHRFNQQSNIRFTYRGNTRRPSVTQLDPTPDNSNPLNIRSGNPGLLPTFSNNMSIRFNDNQKEKQRSLQATVDYSFTMNEIINYTEYEPETGIQYTKPINENGSWNGTGNIMYNMPIGSNNRFKFNTATRLGYNNRIGYTTVKEQSMRNISGTFDVRETVGLSYSKDWFYGQLRANIRYSNTNNSLEGKQDQRNTNFGINCNTQLKLPWNVSADSDINYSAIRGLSVGYNKNELIWNFGFSKPFLKENKGTLSLQWTDILQQRLNISRNITANYIEDSEYRALTSYVMASFTYRFNNTKAHDESSLQAHN